MSDIFTITKAEELIWKYAESEVADIRYQRSLANDYIKAMGEDFNPDTEDPTKMEMYHDEKAGYLARDFIRNVESTYKRIIDSPEEQDKLAADVDKSLTQELKKFFTKSEPDIQYWNSLDRINYSEFLCCCLGYDFDHMKMGLFQYNIDPGDEWGLKDFNPLTDLDIPFFREQYKAREIFERSDLRAKNRVTLFEYCKLFEKRGYKLPKHLKDVTDKKTKGKLHGSEKSSLYKIIVGLLEISYPNNHTYNEILGDFAKSGCELVDEGTLSKHLKAALEAFPPHKKTE